MAVFSVRPTLRRPAALIVAPASVAAPCLFVSAVVAQPASGQKPTNLTATQVPGGIQLNWDAPQADSEEISGYQILRRRTDRGHAQFQVLVPDTGSAATSYLDTTANADGVSHLYGVRARRGEYLGGGWLSDWSNKVLLTVTDPEPAPESEPQPALETAPKLEPISTLDPLAEPVAPVSVVVEPGDVTDLDAPIFSDGALDGGTDRVNTYRFTITVPRKLGLGLREQETNADLVLVDAEGAELRAGRKPGTANEWFKLTLLAGASDVRVEAQEAGVSNYVCRYGVEAPNRQTVRSGVSSKASNAVSVTYKEPQPSDTTSGTTTLTYIPPPEPEVSDQHQTPFGGVILVSNDGILERDGLGVALHLASGDERRGSHILNLTRTGASLNGANTFFDPENTSLSRDTEHFLRFTLPKQGGPDVNRVAVFVGTYNTDNHDIWIANEDQGRLDAYYRIIGSRACTISPITRWKTNATYVTESRKCVKKYLPADSKDYWLWFSDADQLVARGIWSDGTTMWVGEPGSLRAYFLDTGIRRPALDLRLDWDEMPGDMWSSGETLWITYRSGTIEAFRLPRINN